MNIAIIGPIFVTVDSEGIKFTSESLELAKMLAKNHNVSFISSIGNTSVSDVIKEEIKNCGINVDHIRKSDLGLGFNIKVDTTASEGIVQYPSLEKCKEYIQWRPEKIFTNVDAFILGCEYYELLPLCKEYKTVPYIYLPEDFLEYLDDDDEEYAEGVVRLTADNVSEYF